MTCEISANSSHAHGLAIHCHFHHKGRLMSFTPLGLSTALLKAVEDQGYSKPTPIQQAAIPAIIEGKDVLGIAKTGSGKTAAYVLPVLHKLQTTAAAEYREPKVLVLVPTRELADQVRQVFQTFIPALPNRPTCLAVYGGSSINPQMQAIGKADIVIATPGRLLELLEKNAIRLSAISTLVLDEADKMLNLGFKVEIDRILAVLPSTRQNLLFSATLSDDLGLIQQVLLHDPEVIKIASEADTINSINQIIGIYNCYNNKNTNEIACIRPNTGNTHKAIQPTNSNISKVDNNGGGKNLTHNFYHRRKCNYIILETQ